MLSIVRSALHRIPYTVSRQACSTQGVRNLRVVSKEFACLSNVSCYGTAALQGKQQNAFKVLTKEQVDKYEEDGYIVVKDVLTTQEIESVKNAMEDFKEWSRSYTESNFTYGLGSNHTPENPQLVRIVCPADHHPTFRNLQRHDGILDIVEDLIGPNFRYMPQEKLNLKPPGQGTAIPWHQDWAHFPHTNDSVLTVSVLIDDSDRENGCLQVIPKSHKGRLYDHFYQGNFAQVITDREFDTSGRVYLEAPAGSITIHHVRAVHGSADNFSNRSRRVCCYIFNSMDAWPLLGVAGRDFKNKGPVDFDEFNATLVRGEPCLSPRLKDCPVKLPIPLDGDSNVYFPTRYQYVPEK